MAKTTLPSCAICAKAKSKCVRLPNQDACDRCTRLKKECHTKVQDKQKRESCKITKVKQLQLLEEKIESIAHALIAKPYPDEQHTITARFQQSPPDTPETQEWSAASEMADQRTGSRISHGPAKASCLCKADEPTSATSDLSPHQVQILLDRYTTLMAPHMPFVLLPPLPITTTSFTASPWLLQAVITVAHFHDTSVQKLLVKDLIRRITTAVFTTAEKSLDLLQSLLVLCTWYNPHLFSSTSHTTLLHLCMALTTDLEIDRDPATCEMAHMAAAMRSCGIPQTVKILKHDERRAVVGVFWVASTVFTSFRKTDVPSWTTWHQACLDALEQTGLESDMVAVRLVQSQRIMHQAMAPSLVYEPVSLQTELDTFSPADAFPPQHTTRTLLHLQHSCALIAIWEPSFLVHNLDGMWSCISAVASYLTTYASLPVSAYPTVPFTVFAQFAYTFVVMVRACSVHMDGFDGTLLRDFIDFEQVMEQASEKYGAVGMLCVDGVVIRNEGFENWAVKCRWVKTWYGMKAAENAAQGGGVYRPEVDASPLTVQGENLVGDGGWLEEEAREGVEFDFGLLDTVVS